MNTLFETTIIILTDYDPAGVEIEDLAREATSGDAYCIGQTTREVGLEQIEEGPREFFSFGEEEQ